MSTQRAAESDELSEFGYDQQLDRTIGKFASFAAGVSYIAILTGTSQLFYFGFGLGGPAYWSVQRHRTGVLAEHQAAATGAPSALGGPTADLTVLRAPE